MSEYNENSAVTPDKSGESTMSIQDIIGVCLSRWKWFVLSLVVCMSIGTIYLLRTPKVYVATAAVLIKEDAKGKNAISGDAAGFSKLGMFTTKTNVNNELISMKSPSVILEVVRRLNLDKNYTIDGPFHRITLYGETLPVQARFIDANDNEGGAFTLNLNRKDRTVTLNDFKAKGEEHDVKVSGALNDTLDTPIGKIKIVPTTYYDSSQNEKVNKIFVSRSSVQAAIGGCRGRLNAVIGDPESSIIDLTYHDVNVRRAEDFLSTLISVYNENWVRDKNMLATSTSKFINERLGVIEGELGNVDSDISSYKSQHLIPDLQATTSMYLGQNQEASRAILELNNQLYMARYIRDFISSNANTYQLLPANSGLQGSNIESQIAAYNEKLLQRNSLLANSSLSNPLVQDMDANLSAMRGVILGSIDNEINAINTRIRSYNISQSQSTSRLQSNPSQAQYLLSVERQQKVKEALYLFLLQKREENELSQAFTAYNTRIITPPMGNPSPISPVSRNILLISFLAGLLIPFGIIILMENLNTRVRSRKDLEVLTVPFIGEIPFAAERRKSLKDRILKPISRAQGKNEERRILVKEGSRGMINEAFRVVRGNLEFILGAEGKNKVVMVASITAGSGKTFVITNLAASFALKGLKVGLIDLDLRKATLSKLVASQSQHGVTDYLSGKITDWKKLIVPAPGTKNLDIIPVGTIPPNPAELLYMPALGKMIEEMRENYDLVFIDCPPVDIVADTAIIAPFADVTVFLIRAGLLDRDMLPVVENYYRTHKFNNMSVLLNGLMTKGGRYGYKYGYRYSYGYGRGYGYGNYGVYTKDE